MALVVMGLHLDLTTDEGPRAGSPARSRPRARRTCPASPCAPRARPDRAGAGSGRRQGQHSAPVSRGRLRAPAGLDRVPRAGGRARARRARERPRWSRHAAPARRAPDRDPTRPRRSARRPRRASPRSRPGGRDEERPASGPLDAEDVVVGTSTAVVLQTPNDAGVRYVVIPTMGFEPAAATGGHSDCSEGPRGRDFATER